MKMQPTEFDVVCGKGRCKEAGNPQYKQLVNENKVSGTLSVNSTGISLIVAELEAVRDVRE